MKKTTEMHILQDSVEKIKTENEATVQNYVIKYEAKMI